MQLGCQWMVGLTLVTDNISAKLQYIPIVQTVGLITRQGFAIDQGAVHRAVVGEVDGGDAHGIAGGEAGVLTGDDRAVDKGVIGAAHELLAVVLGAAADGHRSAGAHNEFALAEVVKAVHGLQCHLNGSCACQQAGSNKGKERLTVRGRHLGLNVAMMCSRELEVQRRGRGRGRTGMAGEVTK